MRVNLSKTSDSAKSNASVSDLSHRMMKVSAVILLIVLLVVTGIATWYTSRAVMERAERQFEKQTEAIATLLEKRLDACIDMLAGIQGLFAASQSVERDEFRAYVKYSQILTRYPEVSSIRFVEKVPVQSKDSYLQRVRTDKSLTPTGYPDFSISPETEHPEYFVITYVEPYEGNEKLLGFNVWSDPLRKSLYEKAADFGKPAASGLNIPINLSKKVQPEFFIAVPIYKHGATLNSIAERRESLQGFVSFFLIIKKLADETLHRHKTDYSFDLDLEIFDGIQINPEHLLYDSDTILDAKPISYNPFNRKKVLEVAGRTWLLNFKTDTPQSAALRWLPLIVAVIGTIISFLIFLALYNLTISRAHAEKMARQMTRHLRESEERFRQLAENIDEVFWLSDPATKEMFYVSKAYEKVWGRPLQSVYLNPGAFQEAVHQEDRARLAAAIKQQETEGSYEAEYRVIRPDGTIRWIRDRAFPIRDAMGKIFRVAGIAEDITAMKEAQDKQIRAAQSLQTIIDNSPIAITVLDHDGQIKIWNRAAEKMFGWKAEEVLNKPVPYIPASEKNSYSRLLKEELSGANRTNLELKRTRKDGALIDITLSTAPLRNSEGQVYAVMGMMTDITERKKLESQLLQSQKMETVGTLAGGIAHDLNNQLTPVRGYLDLVLKEINKEHPVYSLLKEANVSAARCAEIIQRLLNYSRPSTRQRKPLSIYLLIKETKDLIARVLPSTIQIEVNCPDTIWTIEGNETELQTVLMNLAANARDAMPGNGKFSVEVQNLPRYRLKPDSPEGPFIMIAVHDTGMGITAENITRIFEPFFSTKEKGRGTGLGLAMVFKIIKDHEGWIQVSSTPNQGTSFQIYLPANPGQESALEMRQENLLPRIKGRGEAILFVDDEEPIRNLGRLFLEKLNYKPILATDGEIALEIYKEQGGRIAAVVMDMIMPRMTGKQALQKILEINPEAKIVIMSGYTAEGLPDELLKFGAASFLQKPYTLILLGETLKKVLKF